jgi:hypothetical protein
MFGQGQQALRIGHLDWKTISQGRNSRISRGADHFGHVRILRQSPDQGMFPAASTHHENVHV